MPDPVETSTPRPTGVPPQRLAALAAATGLAVPETGADVVVTGVTHDSRAVRPGDLYAALPGSRVHGSRFAVAAAEAGATAALTDPAGHQATVAAGLPTLVAPRPRDVLGQLAATVYGNPAAALTTIGVTGTNGKTTTAHLLESGLLAAGHVTGLLGTIATRWAGRTQDSVRTTPEAPDLQALLAVMREAGVTAVAMEVSSHALALGRVDGVTYDVAVFTNLSEDHLDFHADLEDYFATKAELFTPERARAGVVDVDDSYGRRLADEAGIPLTTVSTSRQADADWRATQVSSGAGGSSFVLAARDGRSVECRTALVGTVNVANAALAVVALVVAGADPVAAAAGVAACAGVPGRMERVVGPPEHDWLALVDYAHSPDALERLLATARDFVGRGGRLHVVVGAGGDRDPYKRPGMGEIVARLADRTVLTSDNPRSEDPAAIIAALRSGADRVPGAHVDVITDRRAAIEHVVRDAATGDVVVVAGKGHEQGQEIAGVVHPFDDRAVLRAAVGLVRR